MVELSEVCAAADADLVQPKEGPLGSRVEHHEGVNRDHLPTGITN
jgi:hypothetical protein